MRSGNGGLLRHSCFRGLKSRTNKKRAPSPEPCIRNCVPKDAIGYFFFFAGAFFFAAAFLVAFFIEVILLISNLRSKKSQCDSYIESCQENVKKKMHFGLSAAS